MSAAMKTWPYQNLNYVFISPLCWLSWPSFFFERLKKKYQLALIDNQRTLKESEKRHREAFEQLDDEMNEHRRTEEKTSQERGTLSRDGRTYQ